MSVSPRTTTRRAFLRRAGSTVLAAGSLPLVIAACEADGGRAIDPVDSSAATSASTDDPLVSRALRDAARLAATYDAVLDRHKRLRELMADLRADLTEHLDVLSGTADDAGPTTDPIGRVPRSARAARRRLAAAEETAARRRRKDAIAAESGELARLLASIAANHAQHQRLLVRRSDPEWVASAPDPDAATDDAALVDAMNDTLAGEHAAIYAYGVIGGRLDYESRPARDAAAAAEAHQDRRAGLTALIEAGGEAPVGAEPGYRLPNAVRSRSDARTVAQLVEDRCGVLYATLAATATGEIRAYAVDALIDAATRSLAWGAPSSPLPGVAPSA